ncbi:MAG: sensor histidine kinase [Gammaproteobacteria bacterium]|nr:sensor histidine kinase [Gammaproteobacteria bacterium]
MKGKMSDCSATKRLPPARTGSSPDAPALHLLLAKGRERERERIAHELHDGALQSLVGIKLDVEKLVSEIETRPPRSVAAELTSVAGHVRDCIKEIRAILSDLEPPDVDSSDFTETLHRYIDAFRDRHLIQVRRRVEPVQTTLSAEQRLCLFRILQEALSNVARHAHASCVGIELGTAGGTLELRVSDDGRGFDVSRRRDRSHYGLRHIRSRAAALGGAASIQSSPGNGAVVVARIPIEEGSAERRKA